MINPKHDYDVAIVGAGPAGSMLAYYLAKAGFRVALLDGEKFPRKKVCAGGLPARVLSILPFDVTPVIEKEIHEVTITYGLKDAFTRGYHKPLIYTVDREKFDHLLTQKAQEAGADFRDDQKVTEMSLESGVWSVRTGDVVLKAAVLVGADGAISATARELSLKPSDFFHNGLQVEVPIQLLREAKRLESGVVLDWGRFPDSYGWLFPKRETVSIGVQGPLKMGGQLKLYLTDLLSHYGLSLKEQNLTGHPIPHRVHKSPISARNAILIGDAAGLVDFWTGEGIFYAIESAQIAAGQIKGLLDGGQVNLNSYQTIVDQVIAPEIRTSYQFSKIFNCLSWLAFRIVRKYDYPWDVFCRVMRGDRTFLEVKKRFRLDTLFVKLLLKGLRLNRRKK